MAAAVRPGSRSSKSFKVVSRRTLNVHGPDSVEREKKEEEREYSSSMYQNVWRVAEIELIIMYSM